MSNHPRRIAIIVWKWSHLFEEATLNKALLQDFRPDEIESWKKKYTSVYQVVKKRESSKPPKSMGDLVVCIRTRPGDATAAVPFLQAIAKNYKTEKSNTLLFLFLHRNDGFDQNHINLIYQESFVDKCFLFSDGRDFIYSPSQRMGLIDDIGAFFSQSASRTTPMIEVADDEKKLVFHSYFDQTWNYYQGEFLTKLIELREDLLDFFLEQIEDLDEELPRSHCKEYLSGYPELELRIKSLITDHVLSERENEQLETWERAHQKSYTFDDFRSYIEKDSTAIKLHEALTNTLIQDLFFSEKENEQQIMIPSPREMMRKWQGDFLELTKRLSIISPSLSQVS